jgi:hypothetical protein
MAAPKPSPMRAAALEILGIIMLPNVLADSSKRHCRLRIMRIAA